MIKDDIYTSSLLQIFQGELKMEKKLKRQVLHHTKNSENVLGKNEHMIGDCSDLRGDCSGLQGDCSGLWGDIDKCQLSVDDRNKGVSITDLIGE